MLCYGRLLAPINLRNEVEILRLRSTFWDVRMSPVDVLQEQRLLQLMNTVKSSVWGSFLCTQSGRPEARAAPLTGPDGPKVSTLFSMFQLFFLKRIMEDKRSSSPVLVRLLPPAGFCSFRSSDEVLLGSAQRSWSALQTCTVRFFCPNLRV